MNKVIKIKLMAPEKFFSSMARSGAAKTFPSLAAAKKFRDTFFTNDDKARSFITA